MKRSCNDNAKEIAKIASKPNCHASKAKQPWRDSKWPDLIFLNPNNTLDQILLQAILWFHSHQPSSKSFENKIYQFQSNPMHLGDTWHGKNGKNWEHCLWHMVWFCHAVKVLPKSLELLLCSNKQMFLKFLTDQTNDCWNQVYCTHVLVFVFLGELSHWSLYTFFPLGFRFFSQCTWLHFFPNFQNIPWSDCIITRFRCPIFLSISFCDSTQ